MQTFVCSTFHQSGKGESLCTMELLYHYFNQKTQICVFNALLEPPPQAISFEPEFDCTAVFAKVQEATHRCT